MNITVITGSPHRNGTTSALAEAFISGASANGHWIFRFDAAEKMVHSCIACNTCENGKAPCIFDDDMTELVPYLLSADLVVFVSPVYYSGFSSQLKAVIDRFYGIDSKLCGAGKRCVLMVAAADTDPRTARGVQAVYEEAMHYLGWKDCGQICATGCAERKDIENTGFLKQAYDLGNSMR